MKPRYLGDSVYVDTDGFFIRLYLSNGGEEKHEIYLEPKVIAALTQYIKEWEAEETPSEDHA